MFKRKTRRILSYVSIAFGYIVLALIFPALDLTRYLPSASMCTRFSESEILNVAHEGRTGYLDSLVRTFGESVADIEAAEVVQFVQWAPHIGQSVTYRTARGSLYEIDVSPGCGIGLSYPDRVAPVEGRLIYEKQ